MGLDMYAMATKQKIRSSTDFEVEDCQQIHYWRKHPNLHGWMEELYYIKGGMEQFNCVPVVLEPEDLDRLEADIRANRLPQTEGFFFGGSVGDEAEDDLLFVACARRKIAEGGTVFYTAWW